MRCLSCGIDNNAATEFGTGEQSDERSLPEAGAVSICVNCATVSLFTGPYTIRQPTADELRKLLQEKAIIAVVLAIKTRNAIRGLSEFDPYEGNYA